MWYHYDDGMTTIGVGRMTEKLVPVSTMLEEIPKLATEVVDGWPRGIQSPRYDGLGGGTSGLSASPALVDLDRLMFMFGTDEGDDVTLNTLYTWANHISHETEEVFGTPAEDFAGYGLNIVCQYISHALNWSRHRGWDTQMCADITAVWNRLRKYAGVSSRPGSKHAMALIAKWKDSQVYLSPEELEEQISVNPATVRSWASRHKLTPKYRVWDVIQLAYGDIVKEIEDSLHIDLTNDETCDTVANE